MVRAQGGTETAIKLGMRSQEFYRASGDRFPLDCGFKAQGYLMPCFSEAEVQQAHARIALQQGLGLDVEWLSGPTSTTAHRPGARCDDGRLERSGRRLHRRTAKRAGLHRRADRARCRRRERCAFTGLRTSGGRVIGVDTSAGPIDTDRVVLTGGPQLADVGVAAGARIPAGGTRHQVVVTAARAVGERLRTAHGVRPDVGNLLAPGESGGLLWGMSNPDEAAWRGRRVRLVTTRRRTAGWRSCSRRRGLGLRRPGPPPSTTRPDHLPILGPIAHRRRPRRGTVVACAAGHGMMWGPAVAEVAADLTTAGACDWLDLTDLGLDRFDADGRSRLEPEPISLPFPEKVSS